MFANLLLDYGQDAYTHKVSEASERISRESIEESLQRDERRRNVFMVYGVELIEDGTDSRL